MLAELGGASHLQGWQAWYEAEPRGEKRADIHCALLLCAILNSNRTAEQALTVDGALRLIREQWAPPTIAEVAARKKRGKAKARERLKRNLRASREQFKAAAQEKARGNKHRKTGGNVNA